MTIDVPKTMPENLSRCVKKRTGQESHLRISNILRKCAAKIPWDRVYFPTYTTF